jgi:hypothetical protein
MMTKYLDQIVIVHLGVLNGLFIFFDLLMNLDKGARFHFLFKNLLLIYKKQPNIQMSTIISDNNTIVSEEFSKIVDNVICELRCIICLDMIGCSEFVCPIKSCKYRRCDECSKQTTQCPYRCNKNESHNEGNQIVYDERYDVFFSIFDNTPLEIWQNLITQFVPNSLSSPTRLRYWREPHNAFSLDIYYDDEDDTSISIEINQRDRCIRFLIVRGDSEENFTEITSQQAYSEFAEPALHEFELSLIN